MIVNSKEMLIHARKEGYAVPAVNTQGGNFDIIRAICLAAEQMDSPIILAHYISTGAYAGDDWFKEVAEHWAGKVKVPVAIHLDHGDSFETCKKCVDLGFTSIMIDGSPLDLEENARLTNQVIDLCGKKGIPVEAEIGALIRLDDTGTAVTSPNIVDPEEVYKFLQLCQPDSLAIGIGNAHGFYNTAPDIRLDVLEKVRVFSDIPLVLHGCTGMNEDIIKKAILLGVAKINFGTQIRYQYVEHLQSTITEMDHKGHSFMIMNRASDMLIEDVKKIIELSGSFGKA